MTGAKVTPNRWIVSPRFDLGMLVVPLVAAVASLLTLSLQEGAVPLWAYLILIVAFDVSHVWATLYLTYMDGEVFRSRRLLFLLPIPLAFLVSLRLHSYSPQLFWTLLAYVAIYHFLKQQWGFIALYKVRARETSSFDYYLDKWTLWAGSLGPVLLWHASPARQFDWFHAGESFITTIDPMFKPDIVITMVVLASLYTLRQAQRWFREGSFNLGKNLWMVASWISWTVGIGLSNHPLVSAAFINLLHGIPFLALVWYRCNQKWEGHATEGTSLLAWLSQKRNWIAFYLVILVLAVVEESLWDGFVWKEYIPSLSNTHEDSGLSPSFWIALLSIPQIIHYFLDGWIWKLDGSNSELRRLFRL